MTAQDTETPVAGLQDLARERQPERDLWIGVEARISRPQRRRRSDSNVLPYAAAASVCLALLTGLLLYPQQPESSAVEPVQATQLASANQPSSHSAYRPYGNRYSTDSNGLSPRTLRTLRSESLDNAPVLVAERADAGSLMKATYAGGSRSAHGQQAILRANLRLVSQAEREVRRALRSDPDSASLQSLLAVAQEKRAQLNTLLIHEQD